MPWVDAEVVVSLEVMVELFVFLGSKKIEVDLLCTTCECLPSFEPSCERYGTMI